MNGPAAPKDPEKKRPYFYIMKDKKSSEQNRKTEVRFILSMRVTED